MFVVAAFVVVRAGARVAVVGVDIVMAVGMFTVLAIQI